MLNYLKGTSVWFYRGAEPDHKAVRLMWLVLIEMADEYGEVNACDAALAKYCGIGEEEVGKVLEWLMKPDDSKWGKPCIEKIGVHEYRVVGYEAYAEHELKVLKEEEKERKRVERMLEREEAKKMLKKWNGLG